MQEITFHKAFTNVATSLNQRIEAAINRVIRLITAKHSISTAFSGGKDSTVTALIVLEAIRRAQLAGIKQAPHFLSVGDTTIENASTMQHLKVVLSEIEAHAKRFNLPLTVQVVQPSLASQFVVSTLGRGTLVRTNENSVNNGKRVRPCSDSWKVQPQNRARKAQSIVAQSLGFFESITAIGTRFQESTVRASNMAERGETHLHPVRNADGMLTFSPIADFSTDDVWETLGQFVEGAEPPFPSPISHASMKRMHELYRAGNDGICGVVLGDSGNRSHCGARFGCSLCLIAGEKDKSLEAMIQDPRHAHLAGINQLRNYLLATQWDMSKREIVGRTVSSAGFVKIAPDVYSFDHRIDLLRYMLTLDALEIERAENHTDDLGLGLIEETQDYRDLCEVQFEFISPAQIIAIDFFLGMHPQASRAFPAISAWYEVHRLGRRYSVPSDYKPQVKKTMPVFGWFKVGQYDVETAADGLRDYDNEKLNPIRHPTRTSAYAQTAQGERTCYYEEADQLSVDPEVACMFVTCVFGGMYVESGGNAAIESTRFWLNETILKLPRGKAGKYHEMAVRGQYMQQLAEKHNFAPDDMTNYLIQNCISDQEHNKLLEQLDYPLLAIL